MYKHTRGRPQIALLTLATEKPEAVLCNILFGDEHAIQIQLYDPEKDSFNSWIMTYPARAIVQVLQPPKEMSDEEFISVIKNRNRRGNIGLIERV